MKEKKQRGVIYLIAKTISWCVMAILCLIGAFLLSYIAINKIAQAKGQRQPLGLYTIISPSMTPDIAVYDVVFVAKTNPEDIQINDVISYYSTNSFFGSTPITHRVVEKHVTNNGIVFRTKGDANPVMDNEMIDQSQVIGKVRFVIPQLGRVQFFLASKFGWFTVILIPAMGVIIYDIMKLLKLIKVRNRMQELEEEQEDDLPTRRKKEEMEEKPKPKRGRPKKIN